MATAIPRPLDSGNRRFFAKVFKANGDYIGTYPAVKDQFEYSQAINTAGTTTTIQLARSANNTIEKRSPWTDHNGNAYVDHNNNPYFLTSRTSNTVGPDTDVMNGHLIEVYVVYGRFEPWTDHMGRPYTDHNGDPYMLSIGAPMGRTIFRGKIVKFKASYSGEQSVTVTIASHGVDLTRGEPIKSGSATTVLFASTPIETIVKYILDNNPTRIGYTASSIANTGVSVAAKFALNTKLQGIQSVVDQTPAGWYWYVNPADNLLYLQPKSATADHVFYVGKHLETVEIEEDATEIRNKIYFVGGVKTDTTTLYKVFQDAAAIAAHGLGVYTITDRRFTLDASAQRYAEKIMSRFARPVYTSTIRVPAAVYDIENIQLGQTVGFRNAKTEFINSQVLQIVNKKYGGKYVELQLGEIMDDTNHIIADIENGLANEQYQDIPTTPS